MVDPGTDEAPGSARRKGWSSVRAHLPFVGLLACAAAVYVAASAYQWADLDEGLYLAAALYVVHGGVPFVTFAAREPFLIYWLALGIDLFGPSLFVGRVMVDFLVLVAGVGVYATVGRIASRWAALAAAALFLFNPMDVYFGAIITAEAAVAAPLAWMLFVLFRESRPSVFDLLFTGLLLGVATLTLRDSIVLALAVFGIVAWQYRTNALACLARIGAFVAGVFLTLGVVLLLFIHWTSLSWMWVEYGPSPSYLGHVIPLTQRLGVFGYMAVFEPTLLVLLVLGPGALLMMVGRSWWGRRFAEASGVVVVLFPWLAVTYFTYGTGDLLFYGAVVLGVLLLFAWFYSLSLLRQAPERTPGDSRVTLPILFCLVWVLFVSLVDGVLSGTNYTHHLFELSLPASVVGGILLARLFAPAPTSSPNGTGSRPPAPAHRGVGVGPSGRRSKALNVAVVVFLVGASLFSAIAVLGPSNPYNQPIAYGLPETNSEQRVYSQSLISEVASYIDVSTPANATLFSGDLVFLTTADRPNLLNLTIVIDVYDRPHNFSTLPLGTNPNDLAPSWSSIFATWNTTYVPMVVVGARTVSLETNFPYLATYIASRYVMVQTFGNPLTPSAVQVWALGRPAPSGTLTTNVPGPGSNISSTSYLAPWGEVTSSAWNSSTINLYLASNLSRCGQLTIPNSSPGIRFLAFDARTGQLWATTLSRALVIVSLSAGCHASRAFELNLTSPAMAIAFDPARGTALVLMDSPSMLAVLNDSTGKQIASYPVVGSPAALAVQSRTGKVYVASGASPLLGVYNESTGAVVSQFDLGFEANNVFVNSSVVVVTWSAVGLVQWLNASSGALIQSIRAGNELFGFAVDEQMFAVASYTTGVVTFFDIVNGTYAGTLTTGACPGSMAFTANSSGLVLGGACSASVELWSLQPRIEFSIGSPGPGNSVTLQGLPVSTPAQISLLPGSYVLSVSGPGLVSQGFVLDLSSNTSWSPGLGVSVSAVEQLQEEFAFAVAVASVAVVVLFVAFPPPPRGVVATPKQPPREDRPPQEP